MKTLFFIFILVTNLFAFENDLVLKGGLSYSNAKVKGISGTEDTMKGAGFSTHFGYRWTKWEVNFSSYIFWGEVDELTYRAQGQTFTGDAHLRHVSFGPTVKYIIQSFEPYKNWKFYTGLGPSWSLQTIKLDEPDAGNQSIFDENHKLTYDSQGGFLFFGAEEQTKYKEMHPAYIEILYSYKKSKELKVVDSRDFTETNILSTEESKQDLSGHFFMVTIGITIF
tara:strand:- start:143023 stop:143694 length:672 start_codon:yes stop_codon:yes gene_type:complete